MCWHLTLSLSSKLEKLARRVLVIQATSTKSERLFSHSGHCLATCTGITATVTIIAETVTILKVTVTGIIIGVTGNFFSEGLEHLAQGHETFYGTLIRIPCI